MTNTINTINFKQLETVNDQLDQLEKCLDKRSPVSIVYKVGAIAAAALQWFLFYNSLTFAPLSSALLFTVLSVKWCFFSNQLPFSQTEFDALEKELSIENRDSSITKVYEFLHTTQILSKEEVNSPTNSCKKLEFSRKPTTSDSLKTKVPYLLQSDQFIDSYSGAYPELSGCDLQNITKIQKFVKHLRYFLPPQSGGTLSFKEVLGDPLAPCLKKISAVATQFFTSEYKPESSTS